MEKTLHFLFGIHNHQPVGNFHHIFRRATQECYRPFISTLSGFPDIKATLHFSGSLIDWLLKNDPNLLKMVKVMLGRGQVELLTGGYYEPILTMIPKRDAVGQIKMHKNFIRDYFEYDAKGLWLSERVWDPTLISTLLEAGIEYILLDEYHFLRAGIFQDRLHGYYTIEHEGKKISAFPISKEMRYLVPFANPSKSIAYLKSRAKGSGINALTLVDDGEKFGLWPGTNNLVYRKKWLEKFFQALLVNREWLKTHTMGSFMRETQACGSTSLPASSYEEMMGWCIGDFNNFFKKYDESKRLKDLMWYVSERIERETPKNNEIKHFLYKGQCNCTYWHGVFGGIYVSRLRHAAYHNLIIAHSALDKRDEQQWFSKESFDLDSDGNNEYILKNPYFNLFVAPSRGGSIFELDHKEKKVNLFEAITRRPEQYHKELSTGKKRILKLHKGIPKSIYELLGEKEHGLENYLHYDKNRKVSLVDHFFKASESLNSIKEACYEELGNFVDTEYVAREIEFERGMALLLKRVGTVRVREKDILFRVTKEISFNDEDPRINIAYTLENLGNESVDILFGVEFNVSFENQDSSNFLRLFGEYGQKDYALDQDIDVSDVRHVFCVDGTRDLKTSIYCDKRPKIWIYPQETVSASESGFERNYQHTVIIPYWNVGGQKTWKTSITLVISPQQTIVKSK